MNVTNMKIKQLELIKSYQQPQLKKRQHVFPKACAPVKWQCHLSDASQPDLQQQLGQPDVTPVARFQQKAAEEKRVKFSLRLSWNSSLHTMMLGRCRRYSLQPPNFSKESSPEQVHLLRYKAISLAYA